MIASHGRRLSELARRGAVAQPYAYEVGSDQQVSWYIYCPFPSPRDALRYADLGILAFASLLSLWWYILFSGVLIFPYFSFLPVLAYTK
jgi:hypothetical protein